MWDKASSILNAFPFRLFRPESKTFVSIIASSLCIMVLYTILKKQSRLISIRSREELFKP
jgi:peptidoglycan biosynthesis protein MviN/MurJ (putative lipid II flippase)